MITKEWGAASPQLLQALVLNEALQTVIIEFTKAGQDGKETIYHTINFTNAQIASVTHYMGTLPPNTPPGQKYETVTLVYGDQLVTGVGGSLAYPGRVKRFGDWA